MSDTILSRVEYSETSPSGLVWIVGTKKSKPGSHVGTLSTGKYTRWRVNFKGKQLSVHRLVWELLNGPVPEGAEVDHINHDPSDNRIENLRLANRSENTVNKRTYVRDLPRGVYVHSQGGYACKFSMHGKIYSYYSTVKEEAIEWCEKTRAKVQGKYYTEEVI